MALGGTVAEEITYREISTGASNDLERCTGLARRMVKQFGMSGLGRVCYQEQQGPAFLNGTYGESMREYSEQTAREIDVEVRKIIDDATEEVRAILRARRAALEAVAQTLMERDTIDGSELRSLIEQHLPGPHLVPGTQPVEGPKEEPPVTLSERFHNDAAGER